MRIFAVEIICCSIRYTLYLHTLGLWIRLVNYLAKLGIRQSVPLPCGWVRAKFKTNTFLIKKLNSFINILWSDEKPQTGIRWKILMKNLRKTNFNSKHLFNVSYSNMDNLEFQGPGTARQYYADHWSSVIRQNRLSKLSFVRNLGYFVES